MASKRDFERDLNRNSYFLSLPHFVQESIRQSGVEVCCDDDLKRIAENLMKGNP